MTHPYDETTAKQFRAFAGVVRGEHQLYAHLADEIAGDPELLALAGSTMPGQPPPNVLFAAVQFLLLGGVEHSLAAWYPEISKSAPPGSDAFPAFREFCLAYRQDLQPLLRSRRTQTNEVARCLALLPAVATAAARHRQPLSIVEIGTSAGLLLAFDRFRYTYGERFWGPASSPVHLTTELIGGHPPLPEIALPIDRRVGIDLHPLDVTDTEDMRWLESLVWPGQAERRRRLTSAIEISAADPPDIREGDALERVAGVIAGLPRETRPLVFHSFALIQWTAEQRDELSRVLRECGRPVTRIWLEWFGYERNRPAIRLFEYEDGEEMVETLGRFHHHGDWLDWGWTQPATSS